MTSVKSLLVDQLPIEDFPATFLLETDRTRLGAVGVLSQTLVHSPFGPMYGATLELDDGELVLGVPALPVRLVFRTTRDDKTARVRAFMGEDWLVEVEDIEVAIRLESSLLRPLEQGRPYVEASASGGLRVTPRGVELLDPSARFTLPAAEIAGTGILVKLDGMIFDLSRTSTPSELSALGYGDDFVGVYIEHADLRVLNPLRIGNGYGLGLTAQGVVLGTNGVSFKLRRSFNLSSTADGIDSQASETAGHLLHASWPLAIGDVELEVRDNVPVALRAEGVMRLPFVKATAVANFELARAADGALEYLARLATPGGGFLRTPMGTVKYSDLGLEARLTDGAANFEGVLTGLQVNLDPLHLRLDSAAVSVKHSASRDELRVDLRGVPLGPLGTLSEAKLVMIEERPAEGAPRSELSIEAMVRWRELKQRLGALPQHMPEPSDNALVHVSLRWIDGPHGKQLVLHLAAEVLSLDSLWTFLPSGFRPDVRNLRLGVDVTYQSIEDFARATTGDRLAGELRMELELKLPAALRNLPGAGLLDIHCGGADGWMKALVRGAVDEQGAPSLSLELHELLEVRMQVPGFKQEQAPVYLKLTHVGFDMRGGPVAEGGFSFKGAFALHPIAPPPSLPLSRHLKGLFEPIKTAGLSGTASLALKVKDDRAELSLACEFSDASVELDVFDTLAQLARGLSDQGGASQVDLDLNVGFAVRGFAFTLGSLDKAVEAGAASAELRMRAHIGELVADGHIRFSGTELAMGLASAVVPLEMPRLPVSAGDLSRLRGDAAWAEGLAELKRRIDEYGPNPDEEERRALAALKAKHATLVAFERVRAQVSAGRRAAFEEGATTLVQAIDASTGLTRPGSHLKLALRDVQFVVPFSDPAGIRVEGTARLTGFAPNDPFRFLGEGSLGLGISADRIYFSLDTAGQRIPVPMFGRYPDGGLRINHFTLGYGFTRNSISATLAGELDLPEALTKDLDTSRTLGAGVRLPVRTRVGFRLDMTPVPGPVPVVPTLDFEVDLRRPGLPQALESGEPVWDGLQVHVPGVYRADLKHIAVSPHFGLLPILNARYSGDLQVGTAKNGLTVIVDEMLWFAGLSIPPLPIPLLADPMAPFFRRFGMDLRLAGFGIKFDIERPFPEMSPLALIEAIGLLADPRMPLDPNGPLARTVRVKLGNARLMVPRALRRLFPGADPENGEPVNVELNLGSVLGPLRSVGAAMYGSIDALTDAARPLAERLEAIQKAPPDISLRTLISALPPELRRLGLAGSFAGFDAGVLLLFVDATDRARLEASFRARGQTPPAASFPELVFGTSPTPAELERFEPALTPPDGARAVPAGESDRRLFEGIEFADFDAEDVSAIPSPRPGAFAGVIVGAYVKLFEQQRVRFLGAVYEDGSFGLVTALDIKPLHFTVAGIPVTLPLRAHGRLALNGVATQEGVTGSVSGQGMIENWQVIPGVLRIDAGIARPVTLSLQSNGQFKLLGDVKAQLFGGAATLTGDIEATETHSFINGAFSWKVGALELSLEGSTRVGPGMHFELTGTGKLLLDQRSLAGVSGRVTESGASVEGELHLPGWRTPFGEIPCELTLKMRGSVDVHKQGPPSFALEGDGTLEVLGATVRGRGGLGVTEHGEHYAFVEGRLSWQGREWMNGRVELRNRGVIISGRTSLAFELTPGHIGNADVASLFFMLDVDGTFTLDASGELTAHSELGLAWQLAAQLPGGQSFPLAMQHRTESAATFTAGNRLRHKLLDIVTPRLLPRSLTLPELHLDVQRTPLRVHKHSLSFEGIPVLAGIPPLHVYLPEISGIHDEGHELPLASNEGWRSLIEVPTHINVWLTTQTLTLPTVDNFRLHLGWNREHLRFSLEFEKL